MTVGFRFFSLSIFEDYERLESSTKVVVEDDVLMSFLSYKLYPLPDMAM